MFLENFLQEVFKKVHQEADKEVFWDVLNENLLVS